MREEAKGPPQSPSQIAEQEAMMDEFMKERTAMPALGEASNTAKIALDALDALGVVMAENNYWWSNDVRTKYERATKLLKAQLSCPSGAHNK